MANDSLAAAFDSVAAEHAWRAASLAADSVGAPNGSASAIAARTASKFDTTCLNTVRPPTLIKVGAGPSSR